MKKYVDKYAVFTNENGEVRIEFPNDGVFIDEFGKIIGDDTRYISKYFKRQHKYVLRDIAKIINHKSGVSEDFCRIHFIPFSYMDGRGKRDNCYLLTRDGCALLVMNYTGTKAMHFKERYIQLLIRLEKGRYGWHSPCNILELF